MLCPVNWKTRDRLIWACLAAFVIFLCLTPLFLSAHHERPYIDWNPRSNLIFVYQGLSAFGTKDIFGQTLTIDSLVFKDFVYVFDDSRLSYVATHANQLSLTADADNQTVNWVLDTGLSFSTTTTSNAFPDPPVTISTYNASVFNPLIGIRIEFEVHGFSEYPGVVLSLVADQGHKRHLFQFSNWDGGIYFLPLDTSVADSRFDPDRANQSLSRFIEYLLDVFRIMPELSFDQDPMRFVQRWNQNRIDLVRVLTGFRLDDPDHSDRRSSAAHLLFNCKDCRFMLQFISPFHGSVYGAFPTGIKPDVLNSVTMSFHDPPQTAGVRKSNKTRRLPQLCSRCFFLLETCFCYRLQ